MPEDNGRRAFLKMLGLGLGAVGLGFAAVPFVRAMSPTRDILAAGVLEADISGIAPGQLQTTIWRKQPVFILKRTLEMIAADARIDPQGLSDPAAPEERTLKPDLFVGIGICTHLGCIPQYKEKMPETNSPGFYCPCHGGKYDTLGRRLGGPPPENLHLLPYRLEDEKTLILGTEEFAGFGENVRKIQELPKP